MSMSGWPSRLHAVPPAWDEASDAKREQPATVSVGDDLLMLAAAQGERQAFATLVQRYEADVRRYAQVLLGAETQARDAAQEAFLRLWQHRTRYQARGQFRAYLFTLTRNLCRSKRRRRVLAAFLGLDENVEGQVAEHTAAPAPDPVTCVELSETRRLLDTALLALDEPLRTPVVLRYLNGMSYEEIAMVIDRSVPTARSRVFYGLKRLAELLPEEMVP